MWSLSKDRKKERERERERETKEKNGITVIDYANDQPSGRCSVNSSPAANAITVWQFAAVQLHLTRIKIAAIIDAADERERMRERERERERNREIDRLLRLDRPTLNGLARMGANIDRKSRHYLAATSWTLDTAELTLDASTEAYFFRFTFNLRIDNRESTIARNIPECIPSEIMSR